MARTQQIYSGALAFVSFAVEHWISTAKHIVRVVFQNDAPRAHVIERGADGSLRVTIPARRSRRRYALLMMLTLGLSIGANRAANTLMCNIGADLKLWLPQMLPLLALTYACARLLIDHAGSVLAEETLTADADGLGRQRSFAGFSLRTHYPAEIVENLRAVDGVLPIAFVCGGELRCGAGLSQDAARQIVAAMTRMHPLWSDLPVEPAAPMQLEAPNLEALAGHNARHDTDILVPVHAVA
jgi:hypothetical protein